MSEQGGKAITSAAERKAAQAAKLKEWRDHVAQVHNWPMKDGSMRLYTRLSDTEYLIAAHRRYEPTCEFGKAEEISKATGIEFSRPREEVE